MRSFAFSGDGGWLARPLHSPEEEAGAGEGDPEEEAPDEDGAQDPGRPWYDPGSEGTRLRS